MKSLTRAMLLAALALALTGCSTATQPSDSSAEPTAPSGTQAPTEAPTEAPAMDYTNFDTGSTLPVLSITTDDQSGDALDFVTEPVNAFVSESISSWTPGYVMPPAPYYEACTITLSDTDGSVLLNAAADVKVRGNWTTSYDKKPLRLKFQEPQNLLGLNEGADMKNWVLLAGYKDASLLRDKTALSIAQELFADTGLYASDAAFVEVEINGQYWGVYLLAEHQQVNIDRVAVTEPLPDYTGTDIGYFLEFDGYYTTEEDPLCSFKVDYADNAPLVPFDGEDGGGRTVTVLNKRVWGESKDVGFSIKSDIYSQEQHDFIANYVDLVYDILYAAAYEDEAYQFNEDYTEIVLNDAIIPQEAVEQVIDAQSLASMYILSELTCDADIYWSSFFMSADFGESGSGKLTFHAPWDFDSAMGNKDRCADGTGFYAANCIPDVNDDYETTNPWLCVLMYEDWFQEIIREQWTAAYDSGVFDRAYAMIEEDTAQYKDAFDRNYLRWDNILHNEAAGELSAGAARCKTQEEAADYLLGWLQTRVEFLNDYWHQ